MEEYSNQKTEKNCKMEKITKTRALHISIPVKYLIPVRTLEETDESFEKSKCKRFKMFDFHMMLFIKSLKEILSEYEWVHPSQNCS